MDLGIDAKNIINTLISISMPIILGLTCGFIVLMSSIGLRGAWEEAVRYNKGLGLAADLNIVLFSFIAFILIGALCVILSLYFPGHRKRVLVLGILSAAIVFPAGLAYRASDLQIYEAIIFFDDFSYAMRVNQFYLLSATLAYMAASVGGSVAYVKAIKARAGIQNTLASRRFNVRALSLLAISTLAFMLIPLIVITAGTSLGLIEQTGPSSDRIYGALAKVTIERIDNNTIKVTNEGGEDSIALRTETPFTIYLTPTCKPASDMEAIKNSGLSATITPAGGLENRAGAYVIISGPDLDSDAPVNVQQGSLHVAVMGHFKDGSHVILQQADI
jgi:hypothetical protein